MFLFVIIYGHIIKDDYVVSKDFEGIALKDSVNIVSSDFNFFVVNWIDNRYADYPGKYFFQIYDNESKEGNNIFFNGEISGIAINNTNKILVYDNELDSIKSVLYNGKEKIAERIWHFRTEWNTMALSDEDELGMLYLNRYYNLIFRYYSYFEDSLFWEDTLNISTDLPLYIKFIDDNKIAVFDCNDGILYYKIYNKTGDVVHNLDTLILKNNEEEKLFYFYNVIVGDEEYTVVWYEDNKVYTVSYDFNGNKKGNKIELIPESAEQIDDVGGFYDQGNYLCVYGVVKRGKKTELWIKYPLEGGMDNGKYIAEISKNAVVTVDRNGIFKVVSIERSNIVSNLKLKMIDIDGNILKEDTVNTGDKGSLNQEYFSVRGYEDGFKVSYLDEYGYVYLSDYDLEGNLRYGPEVLNPDNSSVISLLSMDCYPDGSGVIGWSERNRDSSRVFSQIKVMKFTKDCKRIGNEMILPDEETYNDYWFLTIRVKPDYGFVVVWNRNTVNNINKNVELMEFDSNNRQIGDIVEVDSELYPDIDAGCSFTSGIAVFNDNSYVVFYDQITLWWQMWEAGRKFKAGRPVTGEIPLIREGESMYLCAGFSDKKDRFLLVWQTGDDRYKYMMYDNEMNPLWPGEKVWDIKNRYMNDYVNAYMNAEQEQFVLYGLDLDIFSDSNKYGKLYAQVFDYDGNPLTKLQQIDNIVEDFPPYKELSYLGTECVSGSDGSLFFGWIANRYEEDKDIYGKLTDYKLLGIESKKQKKMVRMKKKFVENKIEINGVDDNTYFEIYDISGRKLKKGEIQNNRISVEDFSKGVYFIRIYRENVDIVNKFIILK